MPPIENSVDGSTANDRGWCGSAAEPNPLVFVIGAGVVGTLLAGRLTRAGVPVAGLHGRKSDLSDTARAVAGVLGTVGDLPTVVREADVIIIAVRDTRVAEVAERLVLEKRLSSRQVVLQTSGVQSASQVLSALKGHVRGVGTLHPLVAITEAPSALDNLQGAAFGVEGDVEGVQVASRLARKMGGRPIALSAKAMALYHAGAVLASNYVVALADLARALLVQAGVSESDALPAVVPLLESAVRNIAEVGLPAALTGPVVRGDVVSVERHIAALAASAPALLDVYKRLGQEALRMATAQSDRLEAVTSARFSALFSAPREGADPSKS